ncbi:MAG: hypothetical protein RIS35_2084 [Pseudomonadota bacterium]
MIWVISHHPAKPCDLTMIHDPGAWYDSHAPELARSYEAIDPAQLHAWLHDLLPTPGAAALDVGAGTGRDAAWLESLGFEVVAVEPSAAMRAQATALHPDATVRWIADALPRLPEARRLGMRFDLILLSAVWMHVPEADRAAAFDTLMTLLTPGGLLAITLRLGPSAPERGMHPVTEAEVERLAQERGAHVQRRVEAEDRQGRGEVRWVQVAVRA